MSTNIKPTKPQAKPSSGKGQELVVHIIERKHENGPLKDRALCGKLWDKPVGTTRNLCEDCERIANRDAHDWRA